MKIRPMTVLKVRALILNVTTERHLMENRAELGRRVKDLLDEVAADPHGEMADLKREEAMDAMHKQMCILDAIYLLPRVQAVCRHAAHNDWDVIEKLGWVGLCEAVKQSRTDEGAIRRVRKALKHA